MNPDDNIFFSQFGEDKWLIENKILPEKGFFLDLGAGHWQNLSNTLWLEMHGWDGVCVDADIRQLTGLLEHRKTVVFGVVDVKLGLKDFYMNNDLADISRLIPAGNEKKITIASFNIRDLVKHFSIEKIDLLSLDIEGLEDVILKQMFYDVELYPRVIIVEYNTSGVDHSKEVKEAFDLSLKKYDLIHTTAANFIYKLK